MSIRTRCKARPRNELRCFSAFGPDWFGEYSRIPVQLCMNLAINFHDHRARSVLAMAFLHDNSV